MTDTQYREKTWKDRTLISLLEKGGVAVMPTDTIYGLVGQALKPAVAERIYALKKRAPDKPCIILIGGLKELSKFGITLSANELEKLKDYWPASAGPAGTGAVSVVLECSGEKLSYLHRGTHTLAFRIPASEDLRSLLEKTGPLIAPSANIENLSPSQSAEEARKYFGDGIDFYANGGFIKSKPSKVIKLEKDGSVAVLRD